MLSDKLFDGLNTPRPGQQEIMTWLADNWTKSKFFAVQAPCGVGKSGIARAIQVQTGAAIMAPNNNLLMQYADTYPEVNFLRGKAAYKCSSGITCEDRKALGDKPCPNCPYLACRKAAINAEPTIFNPISYHYLALAPKAQQYKVLVVDEAHLLLDMLSLIVSDSFRYGEAKFPDYVSHADTAGWLSGYGATLGRLSKQYASTGDVKKAARLKSQQAKCEALEYGLKNYPENYVVYIRDAFHRGKPDRYMEIQPIDTPRYLLTKLFDGFDKVLLMSATMPKNRIDSITRGEKCLTMDAGSPIPVENRLIKIQSQALTAKSDPREVMAWIKARLDGSNTIIHVTYSMGKALHQLMPETLYHDATTKEKTMQEFKDKGGVWLAPACSEGVDLPGETCRLNLIPILPYANIGDPVVKARLAKPGGQKRYSSDVLTTFIQQCGRSTRSVDDQSTTICGDGRVGRLISDCSGDVPRSFLNALRFK